MKRWKKIAIVLLAVVLLAQIPFIYNRYRFGQLAGKIETANAQRIEIENPRFNVFRGIIHAHTALGGHSTGTFDELIAAANANRLDFVLLTEHTAELFDTSAQTLRGNYGGALFVNGQEVNTATDRFLQIPGDAETPLASKMSTPEYLQKVRAQNRLALITYPEKFKTWDAAFDGIEVFSLHTNAKRMNPLTTFFDALWSYGSYSELVLAKSFQRPADNLRKFDEIAAVRKITLFAGTDAHSNIGFHLLGDDAGNKIINLKFDDYATVFRLVRNHVLLEKNQPLTQENLLQAVKDGRCYVAFDVLGDARGFAFAAENGADSKTMGDEIALADGEKITLKISAPSPARFVIFRNGELVFEARDATEARFETREKGAYRTEVYRDALGSPFDRVPWIVSNPIYAR